MRLFSLAALSAGLGLALLTAPLAMAQAYPNHHMNNAPHRMPAPVHRVVITHSRMSPRISHVAHVQPRAVAVRHSVPVRHVAMPVHHSDPHHN